MAMTVSIEGAIEAIRGIMPKTAAYLASGDRAQIAAAMMNATGGLSNGNLSPDEAHEVIELLRAANPDAFVVFQEKLRRDMKEPGNEPGAYDAYIIGLP